MLGEEGLAEGTTFFLTLALFARKESLKIGAKGENTGARKPPWFWDFQIWRECPSVDELCGRVLDTRKHMGLTERQYSCSPNDCLVDGKNSSWKSKI
jgi:hypothetical protein